MNSDSESRFGASPAPRPKSRMNRKSALPLSRTEPSNSLAPVSRLIWCAHRTHGYCLAKAVDCSDPLLLKLASAGVVGRNASASYESISVTVKYLDFSQVEKGVKEFEENTVESSIEQKDGDRVELAEVSVKFCELAPASPDLQRRYAKFFDKRPPLLRSAINSLMENILSLPSSRIECVHEADLLMVCRESMWMQQTMLSFHNMTVFLGGGHSNEATKNESMNTILSSFPEMRGEDKAKIVLLAGESGSGKSALARRLVQNIESSLTSGMSLLDSFTDATVGQTNGSRSARYIEFELSGSIESVSRPLTAMVYLPLIEKSRVAFPRKSHTDRTFRVFYEILSGITVTDKLNLSPELEIVVQQAYQDCYIPKDGALYKFKYLNSASKHSSDNSSSSNKSGTYVRISQKPQLTKDLEENRIKFAALLSNLGNNGFVKEDIGTLLRLLFAVLHVGNIDIVKLDNGECAVVKESWTHWKALDGCLVSSLEICGKLLQCEPLLIENFLLYKDLMNINTGMKVGTETIQRPLKLHEALAARDGLATALYLKLVDWVLNKINSSWQDSCLSLQQLDEDIHSAEDTSILSFLDTIGISHIAHQNGLEQFLTNSAAEKVQQLVNQTIFNELYASYAESSVLFKSYPLAAFDVKRFGWEEDVYVTVRSQLEDESRLPDFPNDYRFTLALHRNLQTHKTLPETILNYRDPTNDATSRMCQNAGRIKSEDAFVVRHFGGDFTVCYRTSGFCDRNNEVPEVNADQILQALFVKNEATADLLKPRIGFKDTHLAQRTYVDGTREHITNENVTKGVKAKSMRSQESASARHRQDLVDIAKLVDNSTVVTAACIKTFNDRNKTFDGPHALEQLRFLRIIDYVQEHQFGYSHNFDLEALVNTYTPYMPAEFSEDLLNPITLITALMAFLKIRPTKYKVTEQNVFVRNPNKNQLMYLTQRVDSEILEEDAQDLRSALYYAKWNACICALVTRKCPVLGPSRTLGMTSSINSLSSSFNSLLEPSAPRSNSRAIMSRFQLEIKDLDDSTFKNIAPQVLINSKEELQKPQKDQTTQSADIETVDFPTQSTAEAMHEDNQATNAKENELSSAASTSEETSSVKSAVEVIYEDRQLTNAKENESNSAASTSEKTSPVQSAAEVVYEDNQVVGTHTKEGGLNSTLSFDETVDDYSQSMLSPGNMPPSDPVPFPSQIDLTQVSADLSTRPYSVDLSTIIYDLYSSLPRPVEMSVDELLAHRSLDDPAHDFCRAEYIRRKLGESMPSTENITVPGKINLLLTKSYAVPFSRGNDKQSAILLQYAQLVTASGESMWKLTRQIEVSDNSRPVVLCSLHYVGVKYEEGIVKSQGMSLLEISNLYQRGSLHIVAADSRKMLFQISQKMLAELEVAQISELQFETAWIKCLRTVDEDSTASGIPITRHPEAVQNSVVK